MVNWRKIFGLVTLVIASAGPLPLWLHHAQCHPTACHIHDHTAGGLSETGGHSHITCAHDHGSVVDSSTGQLSTGQLSTDGTTLQLSAPHDHDCAICYQLSQVSSAALTAVISSSELAPTASDLLHLQFSIATERGLYPPRGPPA